MDLNVFCNKVLLYIKLEYNIKYSEFQIIRFIESYYWGGNNVPDTARAVVDYVYHQKQL